MESELNDYDQDLEDRILRVVSKIKSNRNRPAMLLVVVTALCGMTGTCRNLEYTFATQSPGFLGPLLNVTDMFRIFGWVFEIYNHKIQICINYRPENITGNPPAYKLSCNATSLAMCNGINENDV